MGQDQIIIRILHKFQSRIYWNKKDFVEKEDWNVEFFYF